MSFWTTIWISQMITVFTHALCGLADGSTGHVGGNKMFFKVFDRKVTCQYF